MTNVNTMPRFGMIGLILLLSLSMIACPAVSSVINDIKIAQDIVSIGTPVVAAFTGAGAAQAQKYMGVLSTGLSCVRTAAEAPGATSTTISTAFGTCFAAAIIPVLPSGTPAYVVASINAAAAAIKILEDTYGPPALKAKTNPDTTASKAKLEKIRSDLKQQLKK